MSTNKKRDRKQKKKKLAEKRQNARLAESLAYLGSKYKTDELAPTWMHTEVAIYETYVATDRKLLDATVFSAIETLIRQMRAATLPPLSDTDEIHDEVGREEDLLIANIRRSWAKGFTEDTRPPRDKLVGVLRSILGTIKCVKSPGPQSQGYLLYISNFLTKRHRLDIAVKGSSVVRKPFSGPREDVIMRLVKTLASQGAFDDET